MVHESNARIVRWSDGSLSLHLGDEIFDIHKVDIQSDYNYLFIREGSGLQGQTSLKTKLTFRFVDKKRNFSRVIFLLYFLAPHLCGTQQK
ncbi:unnamed protein product [Trichobilharzia regenti]|nr:unnamed protein product [Trichobilharzia regenti]